MVHMESGGKPTAKIYTMKGQIFLMPCYCRAPILVEDDFVENRTEDHVEVLRKNPVKKYGGDAICDGVATTSDWMSQEVARLDDKLVE